jgi:hypothetical protein
MPLECRLGEHFREYIEEHWVVGRRFGRHSSVRLDALAQLFRNGFGLLY